MGTDYTLHIIAGVHLKDVAILSRRNGTMARFNERTGERREVPATGWVLLCRNGKDFTSDDQYSPPIHQLGGYLEEHFAPLELWGYDEHSAVGLSLAKSPYVAAGHGLVVEHPSPETVEAKLAEANRLLVTLGVDAPARLLSVLVVSC